jgi:hypothetical protein
MPKGAGGRERGWRRGVDRRGGTGRGEVVQRAVVDKRADGHVADELGAVEYAHAPSVGDGADRGAVYLEALAQGEHVGHARGLDHAQHPLLRLGDHDLEGGHVALAQGHERDVDVDADPAGGGHLRGGGGQAGRAEILQGDEQATIEQLQRALQELGLLEGVADLNGRAHLAIVAAELGRGEHGSAADPVTTGGGAEQDHEVAGPGGGAAHETLAWSKTERHRVDQAVLLIRRLEIDLAADGGDADRVAVVGDPGDGAVEQVARALIAIPAHLAETQRVEHRDRARADREDVAQDAAHAGGGALEGLDRGGVVVGLDLEGAHETVADVDRAGVLARPHDHVRALGGQRAQELLGVLVGAMLAPEQRVHRQLDLIWRPTALVLADELVLGAGETERERVLHRRQRRVVRHARLRSRQPHPPSDQRAAQTWTPSSTARRIDWKIVNPSIEPPVSASTACSGWGIRPKTLPVSLDTPAMSRREPLKLCPGA